jgi:hypothetical protein
VTVLHCGDAILMPQVRVAIRHLWIVATEPVALTGEAILVNLTSLRSDSDTTLVLNRGDHPFIVKASVISFSDAIATDVRRVAAGIDAGYFSKQTPCSAALIKRIQEGILASRRTPQKVKAFYRSVSPELTGTSESG